MGMRVNNPIPAESYGQLRASIKQLYIQHPQWVALLAADLPRYRLFDIFGHLKSAQAQWQTILAAADTVALRAYAQDQHSDPAYDPAVEYAVLSAAATAALDWIRVNQPAAGGVEDPEPVMTPAETAALIPLLQAVKVACE